MSASLKPVLTWTRSTPVDGELCQCMELDLFTLSRLRKLFIQHYNNLEQAERKQISEQGPPRRFAILHEVVKQIFAGGQYEHWLHFMETSDQDIEDMTTGTLPVGVLVTRRLSALFGMKTDFITVGSVPKPEFQPCIVMFVETATVGGQS